MQRSSHWQKRFLDQSPSILPCERERWKRGGFVPPGFWNLMFLVERDFTLRFALANWIFATACSLPWKDPIRTPCLRRTVWATERRQRLAQARNGGCWPNNKRADEKKKWPFLKSYEPEIAALGPFCPREADTHKGLCDMLRSVLLLHKKCSWWFASKFGLLQVRENEVPLRKRWQLGGR